MIDLVKIKLIAGDGGNGRVAFHREKYINKGGPSGGLGGNGGSVIVRGKKGLGTLSKYAGVSKVETKPGQSGGSKKKIGAKADDVILEVPLGTILWGVGGNRVANQRLSYFGGLETTFNRGDANFERYYIEKEGQGIPAREPDDLMEFAEVQKVMLAQILEDGQEVVVCQGGFGGRGNTSFKGPAKTTPLEAEYGTFGERRLVVFELKLLADVGLVGFPNAGKSTLLSKITRANPKIANYPFTTIEPNLGVMSFDQPKSDRKEVVVADIPGLIEGASEGKGLGLDFLRHIENCGLLMFVLFLEEDVIFDETISDANKAMMVWDQFEKLRLELAQYHPRLMEKPSILTLNKIDIYTKELIDSVRSIFKQKNMSLIAFSGVAGEGLDEVKNEIMKRIG
jgi:GTPase